jgi:hypothetical protein
MNLYPIGLNNQTLKGSNIYSNMDIEKYTTPSGSHKSIPFCFYKHSIPTGY